jgi:hypothetical protein
VLHALDRLAVLPGFRTTPKFEELHRQAEQLDSNRMQDIQSHYMYNVKLADLEELRRQIAAPDDSEAKFILDNLVSSSVIYGYYRRSEAGELTRLREWLCARTTDETSVYAGIHRTGEARMALAGIRASH